MNRKIEQDSEKNKINKFKRKEDGNSFFDKFKEKLKNNPKLNIVFNAIVLVVIPCLILGTTVAKYIKEKEVDMAYSAKSFYFESDLLEEDITDAEYEYAQGIDSISFYLKNNADSLRFSEVDINYTATLEKDGTVIDTKTGTIAKDAVNTSIVQFDDLEGGEYVVTAQATSPYTKTLTGKFTLAGVDKTLEWEVVDSENSPIIELTVTSEDYDGLITITYPEGVQPDNTDSKLDTVTSTYVTSNFEKNSSYTYTFFKNNPANVFTKADFTLTKGN